MKTDISELFLKSLKAPDNGRMEISDTKRLGLRLRHYSASKAYPNGKAVWMYEKRVKGGKKRKHTFGNWPAVSLSDARATALEIEAEAAKGIDRVEIAEQEKLKVEAARAGLTTVEQVIEMYWELHLSTLRTGVERKRVIRRSLLKHLNKSITNLTRKDIQEAVDEKAMEGHKVYANRIRGMLLALTKWAHGRGYISAPVGAGIPKAVKEVSRDRVISIVEVQAIWETSFSMGDLWGPFLRLLLLTGQRRGEIAKLRWDEIDREKPHIIKGGAEVKNAKAHITHLSPPAINEINSIEPNNSAYVFTTTGHSPISGFSDMKERFDKLLGDRVEPWHLHDIRTAMATALAEAKVPETVVDRIQNHQASGSAPSAVARVYNKAQLLPERAIALDKWADMVTGKMAKIHKLEVR